MTRVMPQVENKISLGNIAVLVTLAMTIIGVGVAVGRANAEIEMLKANHVQLAQDSRTLIRLQADVDYIRRAIDEIRER